MNPQDRKRAELFARLASLPQLDGIPSSQGMKLREDLQELSYPWLSNDWSTQKRLRRVPRMRTETLTEQSVAGFKQQLLDNALHYAHKFSRQLITNLLDKGETDLSSIGELRGSVLQLDREHFTTKERLKDPDPQNEVLVDLVRIIRQKDFPFRRCAACETIFVRVKNQKYCSALCARKGSAEAQEKKKVYMRGYMKERRNDLKVQRRRSRVPSSEQSR